MRYTEEQKEAIMIRGRNVLVSAAAGSGKTRVLIDRIVQLMLERQVPLSRILVVTFTRAAADEMLYRIRNKLEETLVLLEDQGLDAFDNLRQDLSVDVLIRFVRRSLSDLPQAHISTLHAYCIEVLRTYFYKVDLKPDFRVGSDAQLNIERMKAAQEAIDQALVAEQADFIDWHEAYGGRSGERAINLILKLYRFIQGQARPEEWKIEVLEDLKKQAETPSDSRLMTYLRQVHLDELKGIEVSYRELMNLCTQSGGPHPYIDTLENDLALVHTLMETEDIWAYSDHILNIQFKRLKPITAKKALELNINPQLQAQVKEAREALKESIKDLSSIWAPPEHIQKDAHLMLKDAQILFDLVCVFETQYDLKKKSLGLVDYNDLEHRMIALLDQEDIQKSLRESLDYIFFDEYQDANAVQEAIIEGLRGENNLFFVGDVKQSIYRFRLSDPSLFNKRSKKYRNEEGSETLYLTKNFRSRPEVLALSNFLFENLMTEELGEIDYRAEGQRLVAGKEFDQTDPETLNLTLIDLSQERLAYDLLDPQALYICDQIKILTDASKGPPRYRYKDICILMRSPRTHIADFEQALKNADIPYYSDVSEEQFTALEVQSFVDLLRVINNPHDDLALISVLLGPFFQFTEEDLALIRIESPDLESFREAAENCTDPRISGLYLDFVHTLEDYRKMLYEMDLGQFGWTLLNKTGYQEIVLTLSSGRKRLENVHALLRSMEDFTVEGRGGLVGFLSHLDWVTQTKQSDLQPAALLSDEDDVVRIMSIHKSKGLEFKVVMLCHMEKRFNMRDAGEVVQLDDQLGMGFTLHDAAHMTKHDTLAKRLIVRKQTRETKSEEMRLLYVALTRAEERLYLIGNHKATKSFRNRFALPIDLATQAQSDHLSWVLQALLRSNQGRELRELLDVDEDLNSRIHLSYPVQTAIIQPSDIVSNETTFNIHWEEWMEAPDQRVLQQLEQIDAYIYPNEWMTTTPSKTTVSERSKKGPILEADAYLLPENDRIKRSLSGSRPGGLRDEIYLQSHFRPLFTQANRQFSGREKGTIMHTVMSLLPAKDWTLDALEHLLPQLIEGEWLTEEEAASLDLGKIVAFYASDLGQEVIQAVHIERESAFTLRDNDAMIDGQIDLWFEDDQGQISIVDFKTDRVPNPNLYTEQLRLYAIALSKATQKPVGFAYLYWMATGEVSKFLLDF